MALLRLSVVLACCLPVSLRAAETAGDYWVYVGTDTTDFAPRDSQGIYSSKFHPSNGKLEALGVAAERVPEIFAWVRGQWFFTTALLHGVQNPRCLAVHPNGRYLYTADTNRSGTVSAFQIDPRTGKLTLLNVKSSGGLYPAFLTVDATGKNVLVANNLGGTIAVLPIDAQGRLRDASCVVEYHGPQPEGPLTRRAHSVNLSPDNHFAIVLDTVLDEILFYRFDPNRGTLTPNTPPFIKSAKGVAPRELSFHANGVLAYVVGEGSAIMAMKWDAQRGVLTPFQTVSTIPPDFRGHNGAAAVMTSPSGAFLYASNRGHNSIAVFAIDPVNGALAPVQYEPSKGQMPTTFRIDPTGGYLFAGNSLSGNVAEFQIDRQSGRLAPTGASLKIPSPASIAFAPER